MTQGIYCYIDKKNNKIVYIGKDSYIDKKTRDKDHKFKCHKDRQPFNKILQNNLSRYEYKVLKEGFFSQKDLNELEKKYISQYNPKFNFTEGGEGCSPHSKTKEKISLTKSKQQNSYGLYRVHKQKDKTCKQGFLWAYRYVENGKRKKISSTNIKKLEQKVKEKKLPWIKFN